MRDTLKNEDQFSKCFLVIAGGYDRLNSENILYYEKLQQDIDRLDIPRDQVAFAKSPGKFNCAAYFLLGDAEKIELYRRSSMVIYTPTNEHFGIVPLEGMYMRSCVVATNTGGPTETVVHGRTGFLCKADAYSFSLSMAEAIRNPEMIKLMGENGRKRVENVFSFDAFATLLNRFVTTM